LLQQQCESKDWQFAMTYEYTARNTSQHSHLAELGFASLGNKERALIHGQFLHVDPLKWFRESASAKQEKFAPFCILASCHLACADSGAFQESVFSMTGVNMSTRQKHASRALRKRLEDKLRINNT
jgi:hypothetical protein